MDGHWCWVKRRDGVKQKTIYASLICLDGSVAPWLLGWRRRRSRSIHDDRNLRGPLRVIHAMSNQCMFIYGFFWFVCLDYTFAILKRRFTVYKRLSVSFLLGFLPIQTVYLVWICHAFLFKSFPHFGSEAFYGSVCMSFKIFLGSCITYRIIF